MIVYLVASTVKSVNSCALSAVHEVARVTHNTQVKINRFFTEENLSDEYILVHNQESLDLSGEIVEEEGYIII